LTSSYLLRINPSKCTTGSSFSKLDGSLLRDLNFPNGGLLFRIVGFATFVVVTSTFDSSCALINSRCFLDEEIEEAPVD
jgi:hypothetical protein